MASVINMQHSISFWETGWLVGLSVSWYLSMSTLISDAAKHGCLEHLHSILVFSSFVTIVLNTGMNHLVRAVCTVWPYISIITRLLLYTYVFIYDMYFNNTISYQYIGIYLYLKSCLLDDFLDILKIWVNFLFYLKNMNFSWTIKDSKESSFVGFLSATLLLL